MANSEPNSSTSHRSDDVKVDAYDVALLFNKVGSELKSIDSKSVSPSTRTAFQLQEEKVFSQNKPTSPPPVESVPTAPAVERSAPVVQSTPRAPIQGTQDADPLVVKRIDEIEKRLHRIESFNKAYRKLSKLKRGVSYNVSSNSLKGQVKSADLLLEYVLSELSKGVKTITIKLNEDNNTK